jgi:hypothetical protein
MVYKKGLNKVGLGKISSILSHDVYKDESERQNSLWGYIRLKDFSSPEIAVYKNDDKKSIIVASRGTKNIDDITTDVRSVIGGVKDTRRLNELNEVINRLKNIYKSYHITTTGHSLGALLSKSSNSDLSFGFNELPDIFNLEKDKKHISTRVEGDPVSVLVNADKTISKDPQYNPHTIKQFGDLKYE